MKKAVTILLSLTFVFLVAFSSLAADWSVGSPGFSKHGIDVSHFQGNINWQAAAADGVQFAMIRTRYNNAVDPKFYQNVQGASANGIKVGVYIYSVAANPMEAEADAQFVINTIKDYPISYPVAIDIENDTVHGKMNSAELQAIIDAFCNKIKEAGYYPMVYANDYWIQTKFNTSALSKWPVWDARYGAAPVYTKYQIWQATNEGTVSGISGYVDLDFSNVDYTGLIPADSWKMIQGQWWFYRNYMPVRNDWINDGTAWYHIDANGRYQTSWYNEKGSWYYLGTDGKMVTGIQNIGDVLYDFADGGAMLTSGQVDYNGKTYDINSDGHLSEYIPPETESAEDGAEGADAAAGGTAAAGTAEGAAKGTAEGTSAGETAATAKTASVQTAEVGPGVGH